jgi:hypothetical protein
VKKFHTQFHTKWHEKTTAKISPQNTVHKWLKINGVEKSCVKNGVEIWQKKTT